MMTKLGRNLCARVRMPIDGGGGSVNAANATVREVNENTDVEADVNIVLLLLVH